jgi:hypothetical protein
VTEPRNPRVSGTPHPLSSRNTGLQVAVPAIRQRIALLEARKEVLEDLSRVSTDMRSRLRDDLNADVGSILDKREQNCRRLASLAASGPHEWGDMETTRQAGEEMSGEADAHARTVLALQSESEALLEQILECQRECESVMKERLDAAARALRESGQRRKLNAAYGPACKHSTPAFLDKRR